jgi:hypothetical protein
MKKLLLLALLTATGLIVFACGKRTETETKTTIIEREVTVPAPAAEPSDGHLQRAGEKIDAKVDRKIDEALDKAIGE